MTPRPLTATKLPTRPHGHDRSQHAGRRPGFARDAEGRDSSSAPRCQHRGRRSPCSGPSMSCRLRCMDLSGKTARCRLFSTAPESPMSTAACSLAPSAWTSSTGRRCARPRSCGSPTVSPSDPTNSIFPNGLRPAPAPPVPRAGQRRRRTQGRPVRPPPRRRATGRRRSQQCPPPNDARVTRTPRLCCGRSWWWSRWSCSAVARCCYAVTVKALVGTRRPIDGPSQSPLANAASNAADGGSNASRRTNCSASGAPTSLSMPASSHSIEIGPS